MTNSNTDHELWISRSFALASRGIGHVSPNPPVGAVLVYQGRIIGEGYHTAFGKPHAEVECIRSVPDHERHLIAEATLYVSLEPCCITGKTPPCTRLILKEGIQKVVIATSDPNPLVAGKGIEILRSSGVTVIVGILEDEARHLLRPFSKNILSHQPYVILKWAQSKHGFLGKADEKIWLNHGYTTIWTHRQRTLVDAIMVGARTVRLDDPLLTPRAFEGRSPDRVIYDPKGNLDQHYNVFNEDGTRVFYFSEKRNQHLSGRHIIPFELNPDKPHHHQILSFLGENQIGILMVEGGRYVHDMFIEHDCWDEAWVIKTSHPLDNGIAAPNVRGRLIEQTEIETDTILKLSRTFAK